MAFLEDYTLLDELGQGGYATVYKVRHSKLGYIRAIRVLNAIIAHGEEDKTYQKFLEECKLLLRLGNGNHPNIVHIYQPLLRVQRAIVEMDYVDGMDLYHYLERKSFFVEIEDVLKLLTDIGSALAYCHEDIYKFCMNKDEDGLRDDPNDGSKILMDEKTRQRLIRKYQVIHNDIHSGNIIRRENGNYVLLDFGLAIDGESVVRSSRRKNGAPEFKAPEKWDNEGTLTTQSDIYSFGVVMYEFLAGRVPFFFNKQNSNPTEAEYLLSKAHKEQKPEPIFALRKEAFERTHPGAEYVQDYPQWLEELIMKCLAKKPEDRFKNGKELFSYVKEHISNNSDVGFLALKKENEKLQKQLESLQDTTIQTNKEIDALIVSLQNQVTDATYSKESLYNEVKELTKGNAILRNQLKELEESASNNSKETAKFKIELNDSKQKLYEARQLLSNAKLEISRLKEAAESVSTSTGKAGKIMTSVILLISILLGVLYFISLNSNSTLRQQLTNKDNSINTLSVQIQHLKKNIQDLKLNTGTGSSDNKTVNQLRSKISKLEQQIQNYKTRISTLESNSKRTLQYENTIKQLNAKITELKNQSAAKDKEIKILKDVYVK